MNLPELLEDSGLKHRCLFKGDAYYELKDVAPWIVRLEEDNSFTRNLFTRSDAYWHFWDREPGIYVRSRGTLDELWRHFRKFTKIQDESGKWFYFRFWEPRLLGPAAALFMTTSRRGPTTQLKVIGASPKINRAQVVSGVIDRPLSANKTRKPTA